MKKSAFLALAMIFPVLSGPVHAKNLDKHFQKSFDVTPGAVLDLSHGDGKVTIEPWNENRIDVTVDYKGHVTGLLASTPDFTVDFTQSSNRVTVAGHVGSLAGLIVNSDQILYTYAIKAPAWVEIWSDGDDGSIDIHDWKGSLNLTMDDGRIRVAGADAKSVSIRIQDGDAELSQIHAGLDARCDDGTIRILDSKISSGRIEVADGRVDVRETEADLDIRMDDGTASLTGLTAHRLDIRGQDGHARVELLPVADPDLSIVMDDGDIDLVVPEDVSAAFAAVTDDGSINVKLGDKEISRRGEHSVRGNLGGGGKGRIQLETADGAIVVHESP